MNIKIHHSTTLNKEEAVKKFTYDVRYILGHFENENNIGDSTTTTSKNTMSRTIMKKWTMKEFDSNAKVIFLQTNNITCKKRKGNHFQNEDYAYFYTQKNQMNWKESFELNEGTRAEYSCTVTVTAKKS